MAVPRIKAEAARVNAIVLAILWLELDFRVGRFWVTRPSQSLRACNTKIQLERSTRLLALDYSCRLLRKRNAVVASLAELWMAVISRK